MSSKLQSLEVGERKCVKSDQIGIGKYKIFLKLITIDGDLIQLAEPSGSFA